MVFNSRRFGTLPENNPKDYMRHSEHDESLKSKIRIISSSLHLSIEIDHQAFSIKFQKQGTRFRRNKVFS
jgi:hypothetical protein